MTDDQFNAIIRRLDGIDGRLDGIDGRLDGVIRRLDEMTTEMSLHRVAWMVGFPGACSSRRTVPAPTLAR